MYNQEKQEFEDSCTAQKEEILNNSELIKNHMKEKHHQQEEELIRNFEEKYPAQPKFSSEVLNLQKQMEEHIKKKEYEKANETKIKIIKLCSEQDTKWKTEIHDKKLNAEIDKLRLRQKNENDKLELKIKLAFDEFDKKYHTQRDILDKKYRNKINDMLNDHLTTKNSFNKPSKASLIKKIGVNTFGVTQ